MTRLVSDEAIVLVTLWQECRGEPHEGQIAVAEVIRNRIARRYMSDGTLVGTCLSPMQFSGHNATAPGRVASFRIDDADPEVVALRHAWSRAVEGSELARGALHYLNVEATKKLRGGTLPDWCADPADKTRVDASKVLVVIGRHTFLR